jgi:hypothetical protein
MRIVFIKTAIAVCLLVLGLGIYLAGCSKKGLEPLPPGKDYPVYFRVGDSNSDDDWCFKYYPATGEVDSFLLPLTPRFNMATSADGGELWISRYDTVYVFDIESKTILASLPLVVSGSKAVFSTDNQLVALSGNDLYIIDRQSYSVIYHDTSMVHYNIGRFSTDGRRYYCGATGEDTYYAYRVDLDEGIGDTLYRIDHHGALQKVLPSRDEKKIFIITRLGTYDSGFYVYDISLDSIIYFRSFAPQPARIEVAPNGRYVYLTAGGTLNSMDFPEFSFAIFDIAANDFTEEVKIGDNVSFESYFPLDHFVVTPDSRYLVGTWFGESRYTPVYDLVLKDTVCVLQYNGRYMGSFVCQDGL